MDIVTNVRNAGYKVITIEENSNNAKKNDKSSKEKKSKQPNKTDKKPKTKKESNKDVKCPICGKGVLIKGKSAYGCSEWKSGCKFTISFSECSEDADNNKLASIAEIYKPNNN